MSTGKHLAKHALDLIEHDDLDMELVRRILYLLIRAVIVIAEERK